MKSEEDDGLLISTNRKKIPSTIKQKSNRFSNPISNEIDNDEEDATLITDITDCEDKTLASKMKQRKWWFWAEIVLFLYAFCDFPITFVGQKYSLDQITLYNWQYDLDHNISHSFDIFNASISANSCAVNSSSDAYEFMQRNQMMTSHFSMVRMSVWIVPAMISNIVFGSLSDNLGRRWVFIPPLLGSFSCAFVLCLITFYKANIYFLLIVDLLNGLGGSFGCIILSTVAYVAAQTNSEGRLLRLTILQVFSLIASSISPPIFGELLDYVGAPITMLVTSFIAGLNLIYCITFLPNLPEPKVLSPVRADFNISHDSRASNEEDRLIDVANPDEEPTDNCTILSQQLHNTKELYCRQRVWVLKRQSVHILKPEQFDPASVQHSGVHVLPNNAVRLRILMLAFFLICTPLFDPTVVLNLYLLNTPLCWTQSIIGLYTGLSALVCAVGSVSLTKVLEMCLNHTSIAIICCVVCAVSRIYIYFVKNTFMMFIGIAFLPLTNIVIPCIRTIMTLLVPDSKHGSVLGSLGSIEVFCCYTAAIVFNEVYAATLFISTAFVFVVSGLILFFSIFILIIYKLKYKNDQALYFTDSMIIPA